MPQRIAIDWESDKLTGVEADVSAGSARVRNCFDLVWPENIVPAEDPVAAGQWLAESLKSAGVSASEALVVLPRESVVSRRLDLPNAPDEELPDLVRFQAATKSSTPLDRLALDYLPMPVEEESESRHVLMMTVDDQLLQTIRQVLAAAELELKGVGISPIAVAELVTRIEGEHSADPHQATLVVFQDSHRVEITILQQRHVVFTHQTQLVGSDDAGGIRASIVEINRASIALSQTQHDVEITEVCLVHAGDADPALEQALAERFGGQLHVLSVDRARGVRTGKSVDADRLASYAPPLGMLLSHDEATIPAVNFISPRKREESPDRTKLKLGLAAAGLLLASGVGYGMFWSTMSDLDQRITAAKQEEAKLKDEVDAGEEDLELAASLGKWVDRSLDPLNEMDKLQVLGPGAAFMYLTDYEQAAALGTQRGTIATITGTGFATSREDVEEMQATLEQAGYSVLPREIEPSNTDPDYPFQFTLELQIEQQETDEAPADKRVSTKRTAGVR